MTNCVQCGKLVNIQKGRKFCSRKCMGIASRGRENPHGNEWEAKRIEAIRRWASTYPYPKGYKRPKEHTQPMLLALKNKMENDPEKYRKIAIANLPKNCIGPKNGNWRGGKTAETRDFRTQNSAKITALKKTILARDGNKCKQCGSIKRLEMHHIIALREWGEVYFLPMNCVILCHDCHSQTDSYCGRKMECEPIPFAGMMAVIRTIPHRWQAYETSGNWALSPSGVVVIFVSDMGNEDYAFLVGIHEAIEVWLCRKRGITDDAVTAFDVAFEKSRAGGDMSEPGDHPDAPYRKEHFFATNIERMIAAELGVDWASYDEAVMSL